MCWYLRRADTVDTWKLLIRLIREMYWYCWYLKTADTWEVLILWEGVFLKKAKEPKKKHIVVKWHRGFFTKNKALFYNVLQLQIEKLLKNTVSETTEKRNRETSEGGSKGPIQDWDFYFRVTLKCLTFNYSAGHITEPSTKPSRRKNEKGEIWRVFCFLKKGFPHPLFGMLALNLRLKHRYYNTPQQPHVNFQHPRKKIMT